VIVGYWLTNVLGFVLMRRGRREVLSNKPDAQRRSNLTRDLLVSPTYTLLLVVLLKLGVLRAIENYFSIPQLK
jgi:hypothetical protein